MSLQVIFLSTLLSLFCFGNSFTITGTKDAEYEGVEYEGVEIASSGSKCYFKAKLEGCKKGQILSTEFVDAKDDEKEVNTTIESTSTACLETRCTGTSGSLALSRSIEIGGEGESDANANPGELKKGDSISLSSTREVCMRSGSAVVNIKCKRVGTDVNAGTGKTNTEIEIEEYDPETPDSVIEDAEMMRAESQGNVIPDGEDDKLAKISEHDGDHNEDDDKDEEYKLLAMMKQDENGTTANMQWNNWYRGTLYVRAPNKCGISRIKSYHSNCYEDRVFQFYHRCPSHYYFNHCYWTGYQNHYDGVLNAKCARNYLLNGIYSTFSYHHRDRRFSFLCCRSYRHYTGCYSSLSGFVNYWDGYMNFGVGAGYTFTGAYSYHSNYREDRRWRIYYSYFRYR